jgi:hypothetical protein
LVVGGVLLLALALPRQRLEMPPVPAVSSGQFSFPPDRAVARVVRPARAPTPVLPAVIADAMRETDARLRADRLQAGLREWAALDPDAAGRWALAQTVLHHDLALSAVFQGAATEPGRALMLARQLSAQFPERAPDYGSYLVAGLGQAGAHEAAANFAAEGDPAVAVGWLTTAYATWGRRDPAQALAHLGNITDGKRQFAAFQAMVSGWAGTQPAQLVSMVPHMAPGFEQRFALVTGLRAWLEQDPAAAAEWISRAPPDLDLTHVLEN